jgi:hypothetical protein
VSQAIQKDTDFDSVRSREDFKQLMEELRAKIKAQAAAQKATSTSGPRLPINLNNLRDCSLLTDQRLMQTVMTL